MLQNLIRTAITSLSALVFTISVSHSFAQELSDQMDQVVRGYVDRDVFMGSVLVAREEEVIFNKAYGWANVEWQIPNTPLTKFRLGSITKQFTAAAVLLLEEQGELRIDDLVSPYLPDAPPIWSEITIFHLLTHTSGIPDFTTFPEYPTWQLSRTTIEASVGFFREKPLEFLPGDRMSYSNSGYLLLGYLIERVSGVKYEAFVRENIFAPLGMERSGYDSNTAIIRSRASGYTLDGNAPYIDMTVPHAAGGLFSTTEDLLRWTRGVYDGDLLSEESASKMITPFQNNYGLGVAVIRRGERIVYIHSGGINGFSTILSYVPDEKVTIAVLSNLQEPDAPRLIAEELDALVYDVSQEDLDVR